MFKHILLPTDGSNLWSVAIQKRASLSRASGPKSPMRKKHLEFFRKMLKQQLEELTQKSDAAIVGLLNSTVTSADPLDRTSLELERDFTLRMLDRENKLSMKIKKKHCKKSTKRLLNL